MSNRFSFMNKQQARALRPKTLVILMPIFGISLVLALQLMLSNALASGAHQLVDLKNQSEQLNTEVQILSEEVDSLSSQQNLAEAAQQLGMVSNANPVFLNLESDRVYGQPQPAVSEENLRVSGNLISNTAMTTVTDLATLAQNPAVGVATVEISGGEVILSSAMIPASPTR